jgi:alcohol-forming fatty acyl-CoA reductase
MTSISLNGRHCDHNIVANIVPVDMTVNALIVASYEAAQRYTRRQQQKEKEQQDETSSKPCDNDTEIYNYVSSVQNPLTWGQFCHLNMAYGFEYPFSSAIWCVELLLA